ncbi:hypothetical protein Y032_0568g63, partial [Ancylostoma ceylanicum]
GEIVFAAGRLWHKQHFWCTECKAPLLNMEYYVSGNNVVCFDCHLDDISPKCEGCGRAVYEEYLSVDGKSFHHDCFLCTRCRNPMPGLAATFSTAFRVQRKYSVFQNFLMRKNSRKKLVIIATQSPVANTNTTFKGSVPAQVRF